MYDILRYNQSQALTKTTKGSLSDRAASGAMSLAEAFMTCRYLVVADTSSSMDTSDSRNGQTRFKVATEELAKLQAAHPGEVAIVAFSSYPVFVPGGVLPFLHGRTNLTDALKYVKPADGVLDIIVISDGEPDSAYTALELAKTFQSVIHTIYVGPEGGPGRDFLSQLARASGGKHVTANRAESLAEKTETLLLSSATP